MVNFGQFWTILTNFYILEKLEAKLPNQTKKEQSKSSKIVQNHPKPILTDFGRFWLILVDFSLILVDFSQF